MTRWKGICAYDGTDFTGWQTQPTLDAVQDVLNQGLGKILKQKIRTCGSGRTDAGVHALAQGFHFDADWEHGSEKLVAAMRSQLPETIKVESIEPVDDKFHARFSAKGKRYFYRLQRGPASPFDTRFVWSVNAGLDPELIREAGKALLGEHDFSAFTANNGNDPDGENPIKMFHRFEVFEEGKQMRLIFEASGFMYKMVRSLTGALVRVGQGKLTPEAFNQILTNKVRTKDVVTAPPRGFCLEKVFY